MEQKKSRAAEVIRFAPRFDRLEFCITVEFNLNVSESMVCESWMPLLAARAAGKNVLIVLHGALLPLPHYVLLYVPEEGIVAGDRFVVVQANLSTRLALDLDLAPSRDVRAEIVYVRIPRSLEHAFRLERFARAAWNRILRAYSRPRFKLLHSGGAPVFANAFLPGIVPLAVSQGVEHYRRIVCPPRSVCGKETLPVADKFAFDLRRTEPRRI